jgi:hypothetical protein
MSYRAGFNINAGFQARSCKSDAHAGSAGQRLP